MLVSPLHLPGSRPTRRRRHTYTHLAVRLRRPRCRHRLGSLRHREPRPRQCGATRSGHCAALAAEHRVLLDTPQPAAHPAHPGHWCGRVPRRGRAQSQKALLRMISMWWTVTRQGGGDTAVRPCSGEPGAGVVAQPAGAARARAHRGRGARRADRWKTCRYPGYGMLTNVYCAGCAKDQSCDCAAGFYYHRKSEDCLGMHHRKRERMSCTASPEMM